MSEDELLQIIEQAANEGATELDLSSNELTALPPQIGKLTKLKKLIIGEYHHIKDLYIPLTPKHNFSYLPKEIGLLSELEELQIGDCELSSLPAEIGQLSKLYKFNLSGNPVPIPPEILRAFPIPRVQQVGKQKSLQKRGLKYTKEILDFYFRVQDPKETESLYEAKFLIIGEGGAGKTSLAKKIEDENYQLQPDEKSTHGIDVIQWKFPLENGHEFRVNIWDFGGQEIYHQTHQFFLTKRSLYALVADDRRENTDFYWWLKVAELLSDNSPILIIKNEKQDRQCQVNERQLRGEFTNLKEVLSTNLGDAENRGLAEIKQAIQDYITRLPHVGTPLPKIWVRVRSAIENYSRNYISLEEFCQLCRVNNLTDREDMLRLSRYLHDLGVCLHFQDDATLKHYVILKPEWGTDAVYKVLDNSKVKQNLGCFTKNNLVEIWQDSQYAEMRDELLQLMMRFKLCYPIPNRPDHYIAPQLLNIEQADYSWEKSQNLILRYKYGFMPKGILTRFIVETHPWIENQEIVWQSGVVLNKDGTRAEVIENYNQKEIEVRVRGNRPKELLTVVNYELEKIHRSFETLQYQTLVPCNCSECAISENPYSYSLENLRRRLEKGRYEIECDKSYEMVNVRRLIEDVNLPAQERERELKSRVTPLQQELESDRKESINVTLNIQSGNTDQSRNVEIIGGEMNSSGAGAFNLGDISGTVANNNN